MNDEEFYDYWNSYEDPEPETYLSVYYSDDKQTVYLGDGQDIRQMKAADFHKMLAGGMDLNEAAAKSEAVRVKPHYENEEYVTFSQHKILRQTQKAFLVQVQWEPEYLCNFWVPMSVVEVVGEFFKIKQWWWEKHRDEAISKLVPGTL